MGGNTLLPSIVCVAVDKRLPLFRNTWDTFCAQTVQDFELVLVAKDDSGALRDFTESQDRPFELTFIKEPAWDRPFPARASANQLGLDAARGDIYIGTQDDMLFPEDWLERHLWWHQRADGPWLVANPIVSILADGRAAIDEKWWKRRLNPRHTPIVLRWQYISGHSFSAPMEYARKVRHRPEFDGAYGYEDIAFSYELFLAGCKCVFDPAIKPVHQYHGYPWEKPWEGYCEWLRQKTRNKAVFRDLYGTDPEYGHI